MNRDPYAFALENVLTEIKNLCPGINRSFISTKSGAIVAGDSKTDEKTTEIMIRSFQSIAEKADTIGNLRALHVNGKKGKVILSNINEMYLALETSKNVDTNYLYSITHAIIPTVLKLLETITPTSLETITPTPLQSEPSQRLVVDTLSGFFVGDSVQIDIELLEEWAKQLNQKSVSYVEIEASGGRATQCKVKEINDAKLRGKGIIRIPEKVCKTLEVKKGEVIKVKPELT